MTNVNLMIDEMLTPLFTTEKGRYGGMGALVLAGLLFFFSLIQMFVTWHSDAVMTRETKVARQGTGADTAAIMIAQIPADHIFGQAADDDFLPITSLQLQLTGIIQMQESKSSRAIISQGGQPGKVYGVGDELVSGIKVYAINPDNVVLERNGHLEKLPLARTPLMFQDKPEPMWQDDK